MRRHLRALLADRAYAESVARHGLQTIRGRHTCAHRAVELIDIARTLDVPRASEEVA
jgi:spore maturation protein CgeB